MDGRWNHLRDVAGVSVILGTAVLPGSSSLFRWDKVDLLRTVPGVGEQSSVTLLAPLPELGTLDRRHIAALGLGFLVWGLPPYHRLMMASRSVW